MRRAVLLALLLAACGRGPAAPRTSVLLITLDTTRADRLGCYGNARIETPHLDRLAREGVLFEQAYTAVPSTLPSHCTILTGMLPARHGVHDNGVYALSEDVTTLAERFRDAGWRTGAFVSAFVLDAQFGLAQGFETYDDRMEAPLLEADLERIRSLSGLDEDQRRWLLQKASPYQRDAAAVVAPARGWLEERGAEPFFLWVHFFDPHMDYTPPPPWDRRYDPDYAGEMDGRARIFELAAEREGWGRTRPMPARDLEHMIARYDGELSYMDARVGELVAALERAGRLDETLVLAVADHGEGFGEHGQLFEHNGQVFDEVVRVPLIARLPGGEQAGRRVRELVRTVDLAPTLLELTGLAPLADVQGSSLVPLLRGEPGAASPGEALLQTLRGRQASPAGFSWLGLRSERYKLALVCDPEDRVTQGFLFDLAADPGERAPLATPPEELVERWTERVFTTWRALDARAGAGAYRGMDALTSDALRDLGYTGDDD